MFKLKSNLVLFIVSISVGGVALASGGVSDGGGGTTNPHPTNPDAIVMTAGREGARLLLSWLNSQERTFLGWSAEEQANSPYLKLFKPNEPSTETIFELLKKTPIEMRMKESCYDQNGVAFDGSIFSNVKGGICISPFSMAPKLNEVNVWYETAALILHELTHLVGATEEEARSIQYDAILDLSRIDPFEVLLKQNMWADRSSVGRIPLSLFKINLMLWGPGDIHQREVEDFQNEFLRVRDEMSGFLTRVSFLRESTSELFTPQMVREDVIKQAVCAWDEKEDQSIRDWCRDQLKRGFGDAKTATAREIVSRRVQIDPNHFGKEYDRIIVARPDVPNDLINELIGLSDYLMVVLDELNILKNQQFDIRRN